MLIKCFAQCSPLEIVNAIGLTLADLFIRVPTTRMSREDRALLRSRLLDAHRVATLTGIQLELTIVALACRQLIAGVPMNELDSQRLLASNERIAAAREVFRGQ